MSGRGSKRHGAVFEGKSAALWGHPERCQEAAEKLRALGLKIKTGDAAARADIGFFCSASDKASIPERHPKKFFFVAFNKKDGDQVNELFNPKSANTENKFVDYMWINEERPFERALALAFNIPLQVTQSSDGQTEKERNKAEKLEELREVIQELSPSMEYEKARVILKEAVGSGSVAKIARQFSLLVEQDDSTSIVRKHLPPTLLEKLRSQENLRLAKAMAKIEEKRIPRENVGDIDTYLDALESRCNEVPGPFSRLGLGELDNWAASQVQVSVPEKGSSGLLNLIETAAKSSQDNGWIFEGKPGSGKSVLLRQVAAQLIKKNRRATNWEELRLVPVLLDLGYRSFLSSNTSPLWRRLEDPHFLWRSAQEQIGLGSEVDLEESFERLRKHASGLCLLFDGFDEVPAEAVDAVRKRLGVLIGGHLRAAQVVIMTRPLSTPLEHWGLRVGILKPLEFETKREIIRSWMSDSGRESDRANLENQIKVGALARLTQSPLMLALAVKRALARRKVLAPGTKIASSRTQLLGEFLDVVLYERHRDSGQAVNPPPGLKTALAMIAFESLSARQQDRDDRGQVHEDRVQVHGDSSWIEQKLRKHNLNIAVEGIFATSLIKQEKGLIEWWHKETAEFLAARWLLDSTQIRKDFLQRYLDTRSQRDSWSAVCMHLIALSGGKISAESLFSDAAGLRARTLAELDQLPLEERLNQAWNLDSDYWRGFVFERVLAEVSVSPQQSTTKRIASWATLRLRKALDSGTLSQVSQLFYLIQRTDRNFDRPTFFRNYFSCEVPAFEALPHQNLGDRLHTPSSPESFQVTTTPITNIQFRRMLQCGEFAQLGLGAGQEFPADDEPATMVNWWEANLFAAWQGGSLPSSEQWVAACRIGFPKEWGGDIDRQIHHLGNTIDGTGEPDQGGLRDLRGRVWEWCSDWYDAAGVPHLEPTFSTAATPGLLKRVARGGAASVERRFCGRLSHIEGPPSSQDEYVGFRLVRASAPPQPAVRLDYSAPAVNFEPYTDYTKTFNRNYENAYAVLERAIDQALDSLSGRDLVILDFGCGDGWMARRLSEKGVTGLYLGIDPTESSLGRLPRDLANLETDSICRGAEDLLPGSDLSEEIHRRLKKHHRPPGADLVICAATGHQINKTSTRIRDIYRQMAEWTRVGGAFVVGDYEYPEGVSAEAVEKAKFWIRAHTGQNPTNAAGFIPSSLLDDLLPGAYLLEAPEREQANSTIELYYYALLWRRRK